MYFPVFMVKIQTTNKNSQNRRPTNLRKHRPLVYHTETSRQAKKIR